VRPIMEFNPLISDKPSHQRKRDALTGKFDDRRRQKYLTFGIPALANVYSQRQTHCNAPYSALRNRTSRWHEQNPIKERA
jgi:hypothetical protein